MSTGRGESLAARVAATQQRRQPTPAEAEAQAETRGLARAVPGPTGPGPPDSPPPTRHCWYDGPHGRQAALLLEWRRVGGAWSGRIAVAAPDPGGWALVEMWVGAGLLASTSIPRG